LCHRLLLAFHIALGGVLAAEDGGGSSFVRGP
jgi:hypothetical protein